ncbi:fumarylacetoacetate hydrolase family protein [Flaviflexus massiliensis]|uniref:fumarylacetoacetate hydrolase family protein n=1 Tax=Flaviflexus massiliensis TaxID=1522309 RepID=UPI0006D547B1|nr:fumarylacetoacetate hydrolase family protein [Flaviflexus massiliensis]
MQIARISLEAGPRYAIVDHETDEYVVLAGDPIFQALDTTGQRVPMAGTRVLSPIIPRSKVIGVGKNYMDHIEEMGGEVPTAPVLFFKPNTSVIGPNDPIVAPSWAKELSYEAELAVIIGRPCKDVPIERVDEVIYGYTAANDITARDIQRDEPQWARAKGFDTSCPLGPVIDLDFDPSDVAVRSTVNGELRQDGRTSQMIRPVKELVSYVSHAFSLLPGDVILTGTPAGVGIMSEGDTVTVEIEGLGELTNQLHSS